MSSVAEHIAHIRSTLPQGVTLICVSKFQPLLPIMEAYQAGERDFGESRVIELVEKQRVCPPDIRWHFIGHLQRNKVKQIVPFISMIQSVDSVALLAQIERCAAEVGRVIDCLLEVHVAQEETKTGFTPAQVDELLATDALAAYPHVRVRGIMGMASNTDDEQRIAQDFALLAAIKAACPEWDVLSIGMSGDYQLALQHGSTMVRIGTSIFGERRNRI